MPPRSSKRQSAPSLTAEQKRLYKVLEPWFAKADDVTLVCWDEGHNWWNEDPGTLGFLITATGYWGVKEPCNRTVDGLGCGVKRTRYHNPANGYLEGPTAQYDYSGAPRHKLPKDPETGWSTVSRDARALIRLERQRRGHYGPAAAERAERAVRGYAGGTAK